jgi:hypothetical protein
MTNRLALARQSIADAVATVLPGRVNAFPPTKVQRGLAPLAWIDTPALDPETVGTSTNVWVAVFPLHLVVDGATHSQCALLDDLVAQVVDIIEATPSMNARHVEPGDVFVDTAQVLRGAVVDVAATITARTFCIPTPTVVAVPPEPVPITV